MTLHTHDLESLVLFRTQSISHNLKLFQADGCSLRVHKENDALYVHTLHPQLRRALNPDPAAGSSVKLSAARSLHALWTDAGTQPTASLHRTSNGTWDLLHTAEQRPHLQLISDEGVPLSLTHVSAAVRPDTAVRLQTGDLSVHLNPRNLALLTLMWLGAAADGTRVTSAEDVACSAAPGFLTLGTHTLPLTLSASRHARIASLLRSPPAH